MVTQVIHYFTTIAYKCEKVFDFIIENKMNLDGKNIDGNTPLHIAVLNGSEFQTYRLTKLGAMFKKLITQRFSSTFSS